MSMIKKEKYEIPALFMAFTQVNIILYRRNNLGLLLISRKIQIVNKEYIPCTVYSCTQVYSYVCMCMYTSEYNKSCKLIGQI